MLDRYELLRKDREGQKESSHGAGVVILCVRNCIKVVIREDFKFENY